jgi:hypothetical protein
MGIAGLLFGTACLLGVVAVLVIHDTDELGTVALILAVISFMVQFVAYGFQTSATNDATRRTEQLQSDTKTALQEIRVESAASKEFITNQFARLLEFVIGLASPPTPAPATEAEEAEPSSDEVVRREAARLRRRQILESILRESDPTRWSATPGPGEIRPEEEGSAEENQEALQRMSSWPSLEEAQHYAEILKQLPPMAVVLLERYAARETDQRKQGLKPGLVSYRRTALARKALLDAGLLEEAEGNRFALTELGREVSRLWRAAGDPPEDLQEVLATLALGPE